ncbi:MAG: PD-(D/E)XK nuclease family protein [Candidatus Ornithomonoglobus sp.]
MGNKYELLMQKVCSIEKEQESMLIMTGSDFNLLEAAGINYKETAMCKIIAELLNPNGSHCQRALFLKTFISDVLKLSVTDKELLSASVNTEYRIDQHRRIDIVIKTALRLIPIEVKLYAADQPRQCRDYYDFAQKQNKKYSCKVYYLTLDGHLLANKDGGLTEIKCGNETVGYEEVMPISFKDEICPWLDKCLNMISDKTELYYGVKQLNDALKGLCSSMKNNEIIRAISENSDTIRAACEIYNNLDHCRTEMLRKLFLELDSRINPKELGLSERIMDENDYRYDSCRSINDYYRYKTPAYPAITYKYKHIDDKTEIWFRIEMGYSLYCGFVVVVNGKQPEHIDKLLLDKCIDYVDNVEDWWLKWVYLPDEAATPYFKDTKNKSFYKLFDDEYFNDMIEKSVDTIRGFLSVQS